MTSSFSVLLWQGRSKRLPRSMDQESREGIDEPYRQTSLMLKRLLIFVRCLLCCNDRRSANVDIKEFPSCVPRKMQQAVSPKAVVRMGAFVANPTGRLPVDG